MLTRRSVLIMGAASIAAGPTLLSSARAATPKNIVVMAMAIDDIIGGFDPAEAYELSNFEICGNIYRSLVTVDPADSTKLVGDLAEKWDVSKDGLTMTFHIRKDVLFSSGNPLTSEDVIFSLHRVIKLNKAVGYLLTQFGWSTSNMDQLIRATDKYTVVLTLPVLQASGIVLSCLAGLPGSIVDKVETMAHEVDGDLGNAWLKTHSAGSGPYRLVEWLASDRVVLEANPHAAVAPKTPRLVIRHVADPASQLLLLKKGDIDIARNLGSDQLKSISGEVGLSIDQADSLTLIYMVMNMALPQFQKKEVRQAIKWAVDYEAIAQNITPKLWNAWQSFLPKGTPGAITDLPFKKDVAQAKALLAKGGYPDGFSVTIDHPNNWPYADVAQAIQADLAAIGVKASLLAGEGSQVFGKMRARKHEMGIGYWAGDYVDPNGNSVPFCSDPDDSDNTTQKTAAWRSHFADAELTAAVAAAAQELDEGKRLNMYTDVQKKWNERSPFAFLLQQVGVAVVQSNVTGLTLGLAANFTRYTELAKT